MSTIAEHLNIIYYMILKGDERRLDAVESVHKSAQKMCIECSDIGYDGISHWIYKFEDGSVLSVYEDDLLVL